jgi:LacI family gluconate utilization system Gnt-I transcriptional repressor
MDACRAEIGRRAAEIIVARTRGEVADTSVVLKPQINHGDTLRLP